MEYHPRYTQPFTLREALGLDIEVINEGWSRSLYEHAAGLDEEVEIARLQNSLSKLNDTQAQLQEYIDKSKAGSEEPDTEVVQAFEDNVNVISAQEERITILKMALSEKGVDTSSAHYDIPKPKLESEPEVATNPPAEEHALEDSNDGGVYL